MVFHYYISRYNCLKQYVRVWDNGDFKNLDIKKLIKNDGRIKSRKKYLKYIIGKDEENFLKELSKIDTRSELNEYIINTCKTYITYEEVDLRSWFEYTLRLIKSNKILNSSTTSELEGFLISYLNKMVDITYPYHYDEYLRLRNKPLYYLKFPTQLSLRLGFTRNLSIQLAILVIASEKGIPNRKDKLKDSTTTIVSIANKIKTDYNYFNYHLNSSIVPSLSDFYNPEINIEKHDKFIKAYNDFNILSLQGVKKVHEYFRRGFNYILDNIE